MALTAEQLKANEVLASLSDDQLSAITQMSANDEATTVQKTISDTTSKIYTEFDKRISEATGIERDGAEKTYKYMTRAIEATKSDGTLQERVDALEAEKKGLEEQIANGTGNQEIANKLADTLKELNDVTNKYGDLQTKYDEQETKFTEQMTTSRVNSEFDRALGGLEFKPEYNDNVAGVLKQQAVEKVRSLYTPEFETTDTGERLVFKDSNGLVVKNEADKLNPYTASQLVGLELSKMGVLAEKRSVQGAETKPNKTTGKLTTIDLSGAKTQVEAQSAIEKSLLAQGITRGSQAFFDAQDQAWKDNDVMSLPEQ